MDKKRTKELQPLQTVVGTITVKLPDGTFKPFQVLYGGGLWPWVNGKMQYIKEEQYKNMLRDFLKSEEGSEYIIPSEAEITNIRAEIMNNDRLGLYRISEEPEPTEEEVKEAEKTEQEEVKETQEDEQTEESEMIDSKVEDALDEEVSESEVDLPPLPEVEETEQEEVTEALKDDDSEEEKPVFDSEIAKEFDENAPYDESKTELATEEPEEVETEPKKVEDEEEQHEEVETEIESKEDTFDTGMLTTDDFIKLIAQNSSEMIELYQQQTREIHELHVSVNKMNFLMKKSIKKQNITLAVIIILGILIPVLYFVLNYVELEF